MEDNRKLNEELRRDNRNHFLGGREMSTSEANRLEGSLISTLITIATFLFLFTSPILIPNHEFSLVMSQKVVLYIAWVFLFFSIVGGITQTIISRRFFSENAQVLNRVVMLWTDSYPTDEDCKESLSKSSLVLEGLKSKSGEWAGLAQIGFVIAALLLIGGLITSLMF